MPDPMSDAELDSWARAVARGLLLMVSYEDVKRIMTSRATDPEIREVMGRVCSIHFTSVRNTDT